MSNLSELLPTGGGQNAVDFVASGTLSSGQTVVLKTDGTVEAISETVVPDSVGSVNSITGIAYSGSGTNSSVYDPDTQQVIITYQGGSSSTTYGYAVVGKVSGTSITFGTPVVYNSATTYRPNITYNTTDQKIVISFRNVGNSNYGTSVAGTVSGTSLSFGSLFIWYYGWADFITTTYLPNSNRVAVGYKAITGATNYMQVAILSLSGTTISLAGNRDWAILSNGRLGDMVYDPVSERVAIFYANGTTFQAVTFVSSGGNPSFGAVQTMGVSLTAASYGNISAAYDPDNQKIIVAYKNNSSGTLYAFSCAISGTSFVLDNNATEIMAVNVNQWVSAAYDASANRTVVWCSDADNSNRGSAVSIGLTGTTFDVNSTVLITTNEVEWTAAVYDPSSSKVVLNSNNIVTSPSYSTWQSWVFTTAYTSSNNTSFIGITAEAISDTATGPVNVYGGINTTAKGPITTAVGARSTFNSGSTTYPDMVYDEANQKIILSYRDNGTSGYPTAVVGTVSGTSISWGTPVIIRSNTSVTGIGPKIAYDSTTEQVVIAYVISDIGYAKVGTVSGTSISFGAEATFEAGNTANNSIAYDTANAKVVIAYRYNTAPATDDGYAVVGTVSGTSISFGSRVLFDSGTALYTSTVYDSNTGKIVISYDSNGPKAVVGTVSGTSISFGSVATITMTTPNMTYSDLVYDAGSQKVVLATRKNAAPSKGLALVGTVSGTSISFGTEVEFTTDAINFIAATYDSTLGKVAICYEEAATDDGKMVLGTVSGTSISFTDPITFESTTSLSYVTAVLTIQMNKLLWRGMLIMGLLFTEELQLLASRHL